MVDQSPSRIAIKSLMSNLDAQSDNQPEKDSPPSMTFLQAVAEQRQKEQSQSDLMAAASASASDKSESQAKDSEFRSTSEALIKKLLEISSPRMEVKIVTVLLLEGMMEILMSYVTRLEGEPDTNLRSLSTLEKVRLARRERDRQDLKATKRSYHAMELLCGTSANHFWFQDARFQVIVSHLMYVLLPNSQGNLNHFSKIFQHFVRRHPCDMIDYIIMQNDATRLFDYMLPYACHGQVADAIMSLLFVRDNNAEIRQKRQESHTRLQELGFFERIIEAMKSTEAPDFSEALKDLLLRIIDEASQIDSTEALLQSIVGPKGPGIIDTIVQLIIKQKPSKGRQLTIHVLKALVVSGSPPTRTSALSQPVNGPLYEISMQTKATLSKYIPNLCSVIVKDRCSVTTKTCPLTISDIDLLETIYYTLSESKNKTEVLDAIPSAFWKMLVNSFFEKSSSSIYHVLFFKIFTLMLNIGYEPSLIVLIRKQKLLTRMIDTYEDRTEHTDTRGFILLMLNSLRLMADTDNTTLIHRIVTGHPRFLKFLPTLRSDTLAQTEAKYSWRLDTCPRPPPHLGPSPPIRTSLLFSAYNTATLPLMNDDTNDDATGIDLGSDFAYCLGFDPPVGLDMVEGTLSNQASRRNSLHSSSGDSSYSSENDSHPCSPPNDTTDSGFPMYMVFESLTAEEPPSSSPRKKKKKKRATHDVSFGDSM